MASRLNLLTPGPTPIPDRIRDAISSTYLHHRSEEFQAILSEVRDGLKEVFRTKEPVYIVASSGTGGMEAAVSNCFSPGDTVIVIESGKFGERWSEISRAYGLKALVLKVEWGKAVTGEQLQKALKESPDCKGVMFQSCETSTGVMHPTKEICEIVHENSDALTICDGISAVGVIPLETDSWGIDILISGSQKAFMLPPGLSFLSVSQNAWNLIEKSKLPHYYFDLKRERKAYEKSDTAYTPAISLIIGLREALRMIMEEGVETLEKRAASLAKITRDAFQAIGLSLFANSPCPALTAVNAPDGIDTDVMIKKIRKTDNVWLAGGQGSLKGKIFRVSHMGAVSLDDTKDGIKAVKNALICMGAKITVNKQFNDLMERRGSV